MLHKNTDIDLLTIKESAKSNFRNPEGKNRVGSVNKFVFCLRERNPPSVI